MELLTHGMRWNSFTVDLKQGTFISNIPGYIQDFLDFVKFRFIEILLAITIACAEGGWFGRRIAKQLLTVDVKN